MTYNDKISILMPSKGRPLQMARGIQSALETIEDLKNFELIIFADEDDKETIEKANEFVKTFRNVTLISGPAPYKQPDLWNNLLPYATGDIIVPFSDDQVFRTTGWDMIVRRSLSQFPDKIVLLNCEDGADQPQLLTVTTFILHRRIIDTLGYLFPPYFDAYRTDEWFTDVFKAINRILPTPILIEHLHYSLGKSPMDKTYKDMEVKSVKGDVYAKYHELAPERLEDIEKLRRAMII